MVVYSGGKSGYSDELILFRMFPCLFGGKCAAFEAGKYRIWCHLFQRLPPFSKTLAGKAAQPTVSVAVASIGGNFRD